MKLQMLDEIYRTERESIKLWGECSSFRADYSNPVFGQGCLNPVVMLVGEAPGKDEVVAATPFSGKAGRQLDELLKKSAINRADVFITNAVKFRTMKQNENSNANRTPVLNEVRRGLDVLKQEINLISPKIIATLGNTPLFAVLSLANQPNLKVGEMHGKPTPIVIDSKKYVLFALYHPASAIYNQKLVYEMDKDYTGLATLIKQMEIYHDEF